MNAPFAPLRMGGVVVFSPATVDTVCMAGGVCGRG